MKLPAVFFFALILFSCRTAPARVGTQLGTNTAETDTTQGSAGGIVNEIRILTETGSPSSLQESLGIILDRNVASTVFGRTMLNVNVSLLKTLYPAAKTEFPRLDPPITHSYSRILREAQRGVYTTPNRNSSDFLEHILPFLAYYPGFAGRTFSPEEYLSAIPDLEKAVKLNGESVLAHFFMGIAYENSGRMEEAYAQYSHVRDLFPEAYPAALGLVRIMDAQGRKREAIQFLYELVISFPDNLDVRRQLANAYYNSGEWSRAKAIAAEILQVNSRDGEFVLMTANILVREGSLFQAQPYLDTYAGINPSNTLFLFLRARLQNEVYQNRNAAISNLRTIMRTSSPADDIQNEAAVYLARILMESSRSQDQQEGRDLLRRLLSVSSPPLDIISLALTDAIRREDWRDARTYLARLLAERRSSEDLLAAYTLESAQGNAAAALSFATELFERDRSNEDGIIAYISALIESGRSAEAARMIDNRLNNMSGGALKSRYHYLRSRTRDNEELVLSDLRSSLFEDPRNINALISSFEIYHRRNDERRAAYYLRQTLALAPDNPRVKPYEAEYNQ